MNLKSLFFGCVSTLALGACSSDNAPRHACLSTTHECMTDPGYVAPTRVAGYNETYRVMQRCREGDGPADRFCITGKETIYPIFSFSGDPNKPIVPIIRPLETVVLSQECSKALSKAWTVQARDAAEEGPCKPYGLREMRQNSYGALTANDFAPVQN